MNEMSPSQNADNEYDERQVTNLTSLDSIVTATPFQ